MRTRTTGTHDGNFDHAGGGSSGTWMGGGSGDVVELDDEFRGVVRGRRGIDPSWVFRHERLVGGGDEFVGGKLSIALLRTVSLAVAWVRVTALDATLQRSVVAEAVGVTQYGISLCTVPHMPGKPTLCP